MGGEILFSLLYGVRSAVASRSGARFGCGSSAALAAHAGTMRRAASVPASMSSMGKAIPKHELRKLRHRVAKLRTQGHEIWTDEEVQKEGWLMEPAFPSTTGGLHVDNEMQKETWDCGLACVQMVLGTLGDLKPTQQELAARLVGKSVWSIDLAYVLCEYGVAATYLTLAPTAIAANYSSKSFYAETIDTDVVRVNRLLRAASSEGVDVEARSLSANELWNLLSEEETLVVALVDHNLLYARPHHGNPRSQPVSRPASRPPTRASSYASDLASLTSNVPAPTSPWSLAGMPSDDPQTRHAPAAAGKSKARGKVGSRSASYIDLASLAEEHDVGATPAVQQPSRRKPAAPAAAGVGESYRECSRNGSRTASRASSHVDLASLAARAPVVRSIEEEGDAQAAARFKGHYVIILGVDDARNGFFINDPARSDERTYVPAEALEVARHANGTDDDLLLIPVYQNEPSLGAALRVTGAAGCECGSVDSKIRRCLLRTEGGEGDTADGVGVS